MRSCFVMAAVFLAFTNLAEGQPLSTNKQSVESVTVTGTKSREAISDFIQSFATSARMTGKIARWEDGVCPTTTGLKPAFASFVAQRVKDVAMKAGGTCK
jgi:hypothetical protein